MNFRKIAIVAGLFFSGSVFADGNDFFEIGADYKNYVHDGRHSSMPSEPAIGVRWGTFADKYYLWGTLERPEVQQLGQGFLKILTPGVGIGVRFPFMDNEDLQMHIEAGAYFPIGKERSPEVSEEVIRETLRRDFGGGPWEDAILDNYDAWSWQLAKYAPGASVGFTYDLTDHFVVRFDYRYMSVKYGIDIWNSHGTGEYPVDVNSCGVNGGGCLWQERESIDMTSVSVGLYYRF